MAIFLLSAVIIIGIISAWSFVFYYRDNEREIEYHKEIVNLYKKELRARKKAIVASRNLIRGLDEQIETYKEIIDYLVKNNEITAETKNLSKES